MTDNLPIDRYAAGVMMPSEAHLIAGWVLELADLAVGPYSDWTDAEKAAMRPGVALFTDNAKLDRDEADVEAEGMHDFLAGSPDDVARAQPRPTLPEQIERQQHSDRQAVHAALRGLLAAVVADAEAYGIPAAELPVLLDQVLAAREPDNSTPGRVVSLERRRRTRTARPR